MLATNCNFMRLSFSQKPRCTNMYHQQVFKSRKSDFVGNTTRIAANSFQKRCYADGPVSSVAKPKMTPQAMEEFFLRRPIFDTRNDPEDNKKVRWYTLDEVKKHNQPNDCWIVLHDKVYDITHWVEKHPGGSDILLRNAGLDCTEHFEAPVIAHPDYAREILRRYQVGYVKWEGTPSDEEFMAEDEEYINTP